MRELAQGAQAGWGIMSRRVWWLRQRAQGRPEYLCYVPAVVIGKTPSGLTMIEVVLIEPYSGKKAVVRRNVPQHKLYERRRMIHEVDS